MRLKFKHQKFQSDAAQAVVDVFKGQPKLDANYLIDSGDGRQGTLIDVTGWCNQPIVPQLSDKVILENLNKTQKVTIIMATHDLDELKIVKPRIICLAKTIKYDGDFENWQGNLE